MTSVITKTATHSTCKRCIGCGSAWSVNGLALERTSQCGKGNAPCEQNCQVFSPRCPTCFHPAWRASSKVWRRIGVDSISTSRNYLAKSKSCHGLLFLGSSGGRRANIY
jgi:hypothetical protein